jgi:hypothetical protein
MSYLKIKLTNNIFVNNSILLKGDIKRFFGEKYNKKRGNIHLLYDKINQKIQIDNIIINTNSDLSVNDILVFEYKDGTYTLDIFKYGSNGYKFVEKFAKKDNYIVDILSDFKIQISSLLDKILSDFNSWPDQGNKKANKEKFLDFENRLPDSLKSQFHSVVNKLENKEAFTATDNTILNGFISALCSKGIFAINNYLNHFQRQDRVPYLYKIFNFILENENYLKDGTRIDSELPEPFNVNNEEEGYLVGHFQYLYAVCWYFIKPNEYPILYKANFTLFESLFSENSNPTYDDFKGFYKDIFLDYATFSVFWDYLVERIVDIFKGDEKFKKDGKTISFLIGKMKEGSFPGKLFSEKDDKKKISDIIHEPRAGNEAEGEVIENEEEEEEKDSENDDDLEEKEPLNQILYGPPGTGKTYRTIDLAVKIAAPESVNDEGTFDAHKENKSIFDGLLDNQVVFTTFHQSMSYEDFIEGIKPDMEPPNKIEKNADNTINQLNEGEEFINNELHYIIKPGIFYKICDSARNDKAHNYVLIIDEINRGNIAQIFGELITLIEVDKREGEKEALSATLPYSKNPFSVPSNLYIIGTMNTADRSVEALDTALRRRFLFKEMMPDLNVINENLIISGINIRNLLKTINDRLEFLIDRDHLIGHSYFIRIKGIPDLMKVFKNNIIPLLQEYFYNNYEKMGFVLGEGFIEQIPANLISFALFYKLENEYTKEAIYRINQKSLEENDKFLIAIKTLLNPKKPIDSEN